MSTNFTTWAEKWGKVKGKKVAYKQLIEYFMQVDYAFENESLNPDFNRKIAGYRAVQQEKSGSTSP